MRNNIYSFKIYAYMIFQSSPTSSKSHRNTNSNMWHIRTFVTHKSASTQVTEVVDLLPSHVICIHISNAFFSHLNSRYIILYYIILLNPLVLFFMPFEVVRNKKEPLCLLNLTSAEVYIRIWWSTYERALMSHVGEMKSQQQIFNIVIKYCCSLGLLQHLLCVYPYCIAFLCLIEVWIETFGFHLLSCVMSHGLILINLPIK